MSIVFAHHPSASNPFWQTVKKGFDDACTRVEANCQMLFTQTEGSVQEELANIEAGLARRPDALFLTIVDNAAFDDVVQRARDAGVAAQAPVDVLVNNAALIINKPYDAFSLEEYEDQVRVNSSAGYALVRACAPAMKAQGWGRIINLTSVTLCGEWEGYVPYVVSKGAQLGLTKGLARELGRHGITVNAIAPGAVVSEAENRVFADRLAEYDVWVKTRQCLKTRIEADDIAALAVFLASDDARMITSQNIQVDGGW